MIQAKAPTASPATRFTGPGLGCYVFMPLKCGNGECHSRPSFRSGPSARGCSSLWSRAWPRSLRSRGHVSWGLAGWGLGGGGGVTAGAAAAGVGRLSRCCRCSPSTRWLTFSCSSSSNSPGFALAGHRQSAGHFSCSANCAEGFESSFPDTVHPQSGAFLLCTRNPSISTGAVLELVVEFLQFLRESGLRPRPLLWRSMAVRT